jgi:hypothetical protein
MKEEVRDFLLPYVMLHIVRIDPWTHGAWSGTCLDGPSTLISC